MESINIYQPFPSNFSILGLVGLGDQLNLVKIHKRQRARGRSEAPMLG